MGALENKVEKYLHQQVKDQLGGITYKWTSPNMVGVPDRIVIVKGWNWYVEVKTDDGKLSPMQERRIDELKTNGALVDVVYGTKGVDRFIREVHDIMSAAPDRHKLNKHELALIAQQEHRLALVREEVKKISDSFQHLMKGEEPFYTIDMSQMEILNEILR